MKSLCMLALAGLFFVPMWGRREGDTQAGEAARPALINTCLITRKFTQLVDFYQYVLGVAPRVSNGVYAEFTTDAGVLAIFTADAQERYIPGSARPASNKSVILEFRVANVDAVPATPQRCKKLGQASRESTLGQTFVLFS